MKADDKKHFFRDHLVLITAGIALICNLVGWFFIVFIVPDLSALRTIGYNIYFGDTFFGPGSELFAFPILGALFLLANCGLAWYVYNRFRGYAYIFVSSALMLQLLTITPEIFIVYRNS